MRLITPPRHRSWAQGSACICLLWATLLLASWGCRRKQAPDASANSDPTPKAGPTEDHIPIIDVHVHASAAGIPRLVGLMDRHGFAHAVNLSGGDAYTGLRQQVTAANATGGRVTVFATMPYAQCRNSAYGSRMARMLEASHRLGAKGYKIGKALGLEMYDFRDRLIAVDDPELDVVFETAGRLGMPVAIHTGDPLAFWKPATPDNERFDELSAHPEWALDDGNVPPFEELYAALERRFARHPKTTFISVHFGNLAEQPERVARTLRKFPNVYIDTAARIPEMGRHSPTQMRAFFEEFQDRILFGSDLGVGREPSPLFLGSSGSVPPTAEEEALFFSATRRYFETADVDFAHPTPIQGRWKISGIDLPRPILEKVFYKNAAKLLGIELPKK